MDASFYYVILNRGINTEQIYPYEAKVEDYLIISFNISLILIIF